MFNPARLPAWLQRLGRTLHLTHSLVSQVATLACLLRADPAAASSLCALQQALSEGGGSGATDLSCLLMQMSQPSLV